MKFLILFLVAALINSICIKNATDNLRWVYFRLKPYPLPCSVFFSVTFAGHGINEKFYPYS